jgi:hypothetical protein
MYLFTQGRGRVGELNQREGERGNTGDYISQARLKCTHARNCLSPVYKL